VIDFKTCKFIMWGFKTNYHTNGHILEGFYRALKHMGREAYWLDRHCDLTNVDWSNAFIITEHQAVCNELPRRDDCFYAVHNLNGHPVAQEYFQNTRHMHFGVWTRTYEDHGLVVPLDASGAVYPEKGLADILWATDLLPHEIEANKAKATVFNHDSRVINWVGNTRRTLDGFAGACREKGIEFRRLGGFDNKDVPITVLDNMRLIQESMFAPTIVDDYQLANPYYPCRIFKNISYGHYGVTNSKFVNEFFNYELVYNPESYYLFLAAMRHLPTASLETLHRHMDRIAKDHTYLNRVKAIVEAAEIIRA
jgi:hypothetical protein